MKSNFYFNLKHRWLVLFWIAVPILSGCGRHHDGPELKEEQPMGVRAIHPHRGTIYRSINLPGEVHPLYRATLFAKVDGYLKTLSVDKGDSVKNGDVIAEIDAPELRASRLRYKADVDLAEAEFNQMAAAPKTNSAQLAVGKAKLAAAKAHLEATEVMLNYTRIKAPFDGTITKRYVDPGAYIPVPNAADTPEAAAIVDVTDYKTLRMQVAVPENEVRHIALGQPVRWTTDALPGEIFDGNITRAYWALDRATKTMLTEVQLTNRQMMLRPGMLVNARIGLEKHQNALLLPAAAVLKDKSGAFVLLLKDGRARKTLVTAGFEDSSNIEITGALTIEDSIVLAREQPVRDGQLVTPSEDPRRVDE